MLLCHLTEAGVGILCCCSLPPSVPVVPKTGLAVVSGGPVLTQANTRTVRVIQIFLDTNIGVAVTLTSPSNLEVSDAVVIRLQHYRVHEDLVSESVETDERDSYISGRDPVLQLPVVIKVESSRPTVQGSEGDITASQRRNVGEL